MSGNMILTIMAVSNAVLVAAVVFFLIFDRRQREVPLGESASNRPKKNDTDVFSAIPLVKEKSMPAPVDSRELDYSAKVKVALAMLEEGADPDAVAGKLGFSGSEMGVMVAAARRVFREELQIETPPMIQK